MQLASSAFKFGEPIPIPHTCRGENVPPPLEILDVPPLSQSLAFIVQDIDAAPIPWNHWLVVNIPPDAKYLNANSLPYGAIEGIANSGTPGYQGPCPEYFKGVHHYLFRIIALDQDFHFPAATDVASFMTQILHHVMAEAVLMGTCTGTGEKVALTP